MQAIQDALDRLSAPLLQQLLEGANHETIQEAMSKFVNQISEHARSGPDGGYSPELDDLLVVLLDRGSLVNHFYGITTPLTAMAGVGSTISVERLIQRGAQLDPPTLTPLRSIACLTPLMLASCEGHVDILDMLLNAGAQLETRDSDGRTATFMACEYGHMDAVKYLYDKGARLDVVNMYGATLLHAAMLELQNMDHPIVYDNDCLPVWLVEQGVNPMIANDDGVCPYEEMERIPEFAYAVRAPVATIRANELQQATSRPHSRPKERRL